MNLWPVEHFFVQVFNWSEVHLYQSNFLQNPYFSLWAVWAEQHTQYTWFLTSQEGNECPNIYTVYKGDQWVGFDDMEMIRYKSQYIRKMGLGGGMTWALDLDDFMNRCGQGYNPLMNTIKKVLGPRRTSQE